MDFGACAAVLGVGLINGVPTTISGCSTIDANGVDWASSLYTDSSALAVNCLCAAEDSVGNSLDELDRLSVLVPNQPLSGRMELHYSIAAPLKMSLIDITGREVMSQGVISGDEFDIAHLKNGLYIMLLSSEEEVIHTERIIVKR